MVRNYYSYVIRIVVARLCLYSYCTTRTVALQFIFIIIVRRSCTSKSPLGLYSWVIGYVPRGFEVYLHAIDDWRGYTYNTSRSRGQLARSAWYTPALVHTGWLGDDGYWIMEQHNNARAEVSKIDRWGGDIIITVLPHRRFKTILNSAPLLGSTMPPLVCSSRQPWCHTSCYIRPWTRRTHDHSHNAC